MYYNVGPLGTTLHFISVFFFHDLVFPFLFSLTILRPPTQIIVSLLAHNGLLFHAAADSDVCVESKFYLEFLA